LIALAKALNYSTLQHRAVINFGLSQQRNLTMAVERDIARIFEFDRSNMLLQLRSLRREIEVGAEEMEMVAAERVFREPLSRALANEAGKLQVTARELTILKRLVERAHMPKDPLQATPRSAQRDRRKSRS
jgi:hypothetical protein